MTEATLCFVIIIVDDLLIFKLTEASAFFGSCLFVLFDRIMMMNMVYLLIINLTAGCEGVNRSILLFFMRNYGREP